MKRRAWLVVAFSLCILGALSPALGGGTEPVDAIEFILNAFDDYPIVALDEGDHQSKQSHEFIARLIRDPRFSMVVDDVVVEFATARFQELLNS